MNRERIIELARECQLIGIMVTDGVYMEALERFARLVAAETREECARVCEFEVPASTGMSGAKVAAAIRNGGK